MKPARFSALAFAFRCERFHGCRRTFDRYGSAIIAIRVYNHAILLQQRHWGRRREKGGGEGKIMTSDYEHEVWGFQIEKLKLGE